MTDGSQNVVNSYRYKAFGEALSVAQSVNNQYRFTARRWDGVAGLQFNRNRYYQRQYGRWTQWDLLKQSVNTNMFSYLRQSPLFQRDPLGLYGTNDCSYYDRQCQELGGYYYCEQAPYYCDDVFPEEENPNNDINDNDDVFPEERSGCIRQCLQECDKRGAPRDPCDRYGPNNPHPKTDEFWDDQNTKCHVECYWECGNNSSKDPVPRVN